MKDEPLRMDQGEGELAPDVHEVRRRLARHEEPVSPDLLTASFPISMRGYSRDVVDAHIERLNQVIAELEMNRSPRSAVRHALDRVGEQVAGTLRGAREAAEEILASARDDADEITDRAAAEARELVVDASERADRSQTEAAQLVRGARDEADKLLAQAKAEAERVSAQAQSEAEEQRLRLREEVEALRREAEARILELRADTDAVWEERHELLEEIRQFAAQARELANGAVQRLPHAADLEAAEVEETAETGSRESSAADQFARVISVGAPRRAPSGEPTESPAER